MDKDIKARFAANMAGIERELKRLEELNRRASAKACAVAAPQPVTASSDAPSSECAEAAPATACERYKRVQEANPGTNIMHVGPELVFPSQLRTASQDDGTENITVRLENGATVIFPIVDAGKLRGSSTVEWFDPASMELMRTTSTWGVSKDDGGAE